MKKVLLTVFLFSILHPVFSQENKVVGYLPYYRFGLSDQIKYEQLTHLCIAFANPNLQGDLDVGGQNIQPIVDAAHDEGVTVLLSLAGGALTAEWAAAWKELTKPQNRTAFIHKTMQYLEAHGLEGADVDLEWSHVDENYSGYVLELRDSLDAHDMLMTAALPGTTRYPQITDEAMFAFDFINVMAYDLTGSWAPNNPGPHSPYSFAVQSIFHWKGQGMEGANLTLGLPFYGYDFTNPPSVPSFTFGSMVAQNEDYAWLDQVGQKYYNGITTIQAKTELALDEASGVCIWELGQDAFNEYSLLDAIFEITNSTVGDKEIYAQNNFRAYPNPFYDKIYLSDIADGNNIFQLISPAGQMIKQWEIANMETAILEMQNIPPGIYFLINKNIEGVTSRKVSKN
ncbi:MAG TPA: T9SS type A sorting domain-containing protein [Bacteroidetes bacterium]|nr:T9SS type A sorting domain-containing protein [Bacteroidota bacterium]